MATPRVVNATVAVDKIAVGKDNGKPVVLRKRDLS
jgi:hypothetical protein